MARPVSVSDFVDTSASVARATPARSRSKAWCFTLNNPGDTVIMWDASEMDYLVYQRERGAEGTPHLQGYVRFKVRKDLRCAKRFIDDGAHLEKARGTEQQNRDYCTKSDTRDGDNAGPYEFGEFIPDANKQGSYISLSFIYSPLGKRSDLAEATDMIKANAPMRQVALAHPETYVRYSSGLQALRNIIAEPPRTRDVSVCVLWGPTGTGKTHRVLTNESLFAEGIYTAPIASTNHPFDGYSQELTIFLDEFRWENWPAELLNKIMDKWTFQLPCRYQNKQALWTRVIICSNQDPTGWYPNDDRTIRDSVRRRLGSNCRHVTSREADILSSRPTRTSTSPAR